MIEAGFYKTLAPFLRHMCMASDQCKPVVLHLYEIYCWEPKTEVFLCNHIAANMVSCKISHN